MVNRPSMNFLIAAAWTAALAAVVWHYVISPAFDPKSPFATFERGLVGTELRQMQLRDAGSTADSVLTFRSRGTPQIVVAFLPGCLACLDTRPIWERIAEEHPRVPFHAITAASSRNPEAFFGSGRIKVWLAATADHMSVAVGSDIVPMTLVLSPDGVILLARVGVLQDHDVTRIGTTLTHSQLQASGES